MGIDKNILYKIGIGGIVDGELITFDYKYGEKLKPYVCAITGRDFQYGLKRTFAERYYKDFTIKQDGQIMSCVAFKIEPNIVYEYKRFAGAGQGEIEEGYFAISNNRLFELEFEEVRHWCGTVKEKARSKLAGREIFGPSNGKFASDDVDF